MYMSRKLLMYNNAKVVYIKNTTNAGNFRVGTGDDIDISEKVKDGISTLSFKGNTKILDSNGNEVVAGSDEAKLVSLGDLQDDGLFKIEILSNNSNLINDKGKEYTNQNKEFFQIVDLSPIFDKFGSQDYTLSFDMKANKSGWCQVYCQNGSDTRWGFFTRIDSVSTDFTRVKFKIKPTLNDPSISKSMLAFYTGYGSGCFVTVKNLCLEFGETKGIYKPKIFNKTQILLSEPLRKINDTVYDELLDDGTLIRRCGEIISDGSADENWFTRNQGDENTTISFRLQNTEGIAKNNSQNIISDRFLYDGISTNGIEGIGLGASGEIHIEILRSKLTSNGKDGFKQWLSENPVTVIYELATPVTEKLTPLQVEVYKNGHISFETQIEPSQSTHIVKIK